MKWHIFLFFFCHLVWFLRIIALCRLFSSKLTLGRPVCNSWSLRIDLSIIFWGKLMVEIWLDFLHFSLHLNIELLDQCILLLIMPMVSVCLMLVMKIIYTMIRFHIICYLLSLAIINLLNLSKMLHIELILHLMFNNAGGIQWIYH